MDLIINSTYETPGINFCAKTGKFQIKGIAITNSHTLFWDKIQDWVAETVPNLKKDVVLTIDLDYINAQNINRLTRLISTLNSIQMQQLQLSVVWICEEDDDKEIFFIGQDIANTFNCPFNFVKLPSNI